MCLPVCGRVMFWPPFSKCTWRNMCSNSVYWLLDSNSPTWFLCSVLYTVCTDNWVWIYQSWLCIPCSRFSCVVFFRGSSLWVSHHLLMPRCATAAIGVYTPAMHHVHPILSLSWSLYHAFGYVCVTVRSISSHMRMQTAYFCCLLWRNSDQLVRNYFSIAIFPC